MVNTGGHQPDFRLNSTGAGVFTVQLCNCDENIKILFHLLHTLNIKIFSENCLTECILNIKYLRREENNIRVFSVCCDLCLSRAPEQDF